jgi:hypothetical protein
LDLGASLVLASLVFGVFARLALFPFACATPC